MPVGKCRGSGPEFLVFLKRLGALHQVSERFDARNHFRVLKQVLNAFATREAEPQARFQVFQGFRRKLQEQVIKFRSHANLAMAEGRGLTLALSGTQQAPRGGTLTLRVRGEQPVKPKRHGTPAERY
jgi:hypothetical protein